MDFKGYCIERKTCKCNKCNLIFNEHAPLNYESVCFETEFSGWDTESWIRLAGGKELIFGHYEEYSGNAEFIHIKDNDLSDS